MVREDGGIQRATEYGPVVTARGRRLRALKQRRKSKREARWPVSYVW